MSYITIDEFKKSLNRRRIDYSDWTNSDLQTMLDNTEKDCEEYTGLIFSITTITKQYDGNNTRTLVLEDRPLNSIDEINYFYVSNFETFSVVDILQTDIRGMIFYNDTIFPAGKRNIQVIGNFGYDSTTFPKRLKKAILYRCIINVICETPDEIEAQNITSRRDGNYSVNYGGLFGNTLKMLDEISMNILKEYRSIV